MKKLLKKIEWLFDFYIAPMLYNGNKFHKYIEYMDKKYSDKNYIEVKNEDIINLPNDMELGKKSQKNVLGK